MNDRRVIQKRAIRQGLKARIALAAPTGYGKTWSALSIATELQGDQPVLGIDTERGTMMLYGHDPECDEACTRDDHYTFEWLNWTPPYDPAELTRTIEQESENYGVIVIDSLSHFWKGEGGTLDLVDAIAARSEGRNSNTFGAWKQGDAVQNQMVEAILAAKCHVIVTMRSKMAYEQQRNERTGKTEVVKVGLAPVQREGLEFEFTVMAELDREHRLIVTKSRCSLIADKVYLPHREREMGRVLADWLDKATDINAPKLPVNGPEARERIANALRALDRQTVRNILTENTWDGVTPVGAWLLTVDNAILNVLIERLRLPLDLSGPETAEPAPVPSETAPSTPEPDEAAVAVVEPPADANGQERDGAAPEVGVPAPAPAPVGEAESKLFPPQQ